MIFLLFSPHLFRRSSLCLTGRGYSLRRWFLRFVVLALNGKAMHGRAFPLGWVGVVSGNGILQRKCLDAKGRGGRDEAGVEITKTT